MRLENYKNGGHNLDLDLLAILYLLRVSYSKRSEGGSYKIQPFKTCLR